jgi:CIC family chloride channel protein
MSAVFRTPLGAALLAVEVLYRDGFESDALVPAILASVVSYSVSISILGETTLFAHAEHYPFIPRQLPLYGLLAVFVAGLAAAFVATLKRTQQLFARVRTPPWVHPALGGLALGIFCTPFIMFFGDRVGAPGQGLGLLGGGYGAVQMAVTGADWLPSGWSAVELLLLLCLAKMIAVSLTIGSGGSAGDFAPSLVLGGLFGGAFGRIASLLLHDPTIDPGAFALVGMGAFYGGIAHVPLSSLVLVCEMAGSYDLLVPLMLAEAIAFVALRKRALYSAQLPTPRDSPVHVKEAPADVLKLIRVQDLMKGNASPMHFRSEDRAPEILRRTLEHTTAQEIFPVVDASGRLAGCMTSDALKTVAADDEMQKWTIAADLMQSPVTARPTDELSTALRAMISNEVHQVLVVDEAHQVVGILDESDIGRVYLEAAARPPVPRSSSDASVPPGTLRASILEAVHSERPKE